MPKNSNLAELEQGKILGLHMSGKSIRAISKCLKIPKSTVHNQITCYKNSDDVKSALRPGRPKSLDDDDKKKFKRNYKK